MRKKLLATTIFTVVSMALLFTPLFTVQAQAADKIGWVGPIYKELSASALAAASSAGGLGGRALSFWASDISGLPAGGCKSASA